MITINDFIKEFEAANDKTRYIEKHVVTKYVPYAEKIARCSIILEHTMYKEVADEKVFIPNTPLQYQQFIATIVELYTDIDIVNGKDRLKIFDIFEEYGITEILIGIISSEYTKFQTIFKMIIDDEMFKQSNLVSWADRKFKALSILGEGLLEDEDEIDES